MMSQHVPDTFSRCYLGCFLRASLSVAAAINELRLTPSAAAAVAMSWCSASV
jgi:hypothetical protein